MFGYSLMRLVYNSGYYYDVFNSCEVFRCNIEGWYIESGLGVYEVVFEFGEVVQMVDCVSLFKYVVKLVVIKYDIILCFMVKFK